MGLGGTLEPHFNITTEDSNAGALQNTLFKTFIPDLLRELSIFHIKVTILRRIEFRFESDLF